MRNFRETLNLLSAIGMAVRNGASQAAFAVARQVAPWTPFVQQQVAQHVAAEVQHQTVLQVERHASQILWDVSANLFHFMFQNPTFSLFTFFTTITGTTMDVIWFVYDLVTTTKKVKDELGLTVSQLVGIVIALLVVNTIMQTGILQFLYKCYLEKDESNETNKTEQPEPEKTTKKGARLMSPRRK